MKGRSGGGNRKPTALRVLEGNPGKRPLPKDEPKVEIGAPDTPASLTGEALAEWQRIVPELVALGVLAKVERAAVANYCRLWAIGVSLAEQWKVAGYPVLQEKVTIDGAGQEHREMKAHPLVTMQENNAQKIRGYLVEFGLTPASRTRVKVIGPAKESEDPLREFEVVR